MAAVDEMSIGSVISLRSVTASDTGIISSRKGGRTSNGTKKNKKPASPYGTSVKEKPPRKGGRELWVNAIQGGGGLSTENSAFNTWKNGRPKHLKQTNATEYLLEQFSMNSGITRPASASLSTARVGGKGPVYKDPESYYDEIQALKRTLKQLRTEQDLLKAKNGRLQDENISKSRKIEELLNPDSQSNDLRRTLTSKNPNGSEVVMSLRRRIYKLEENLRSKENEMKKSSAEMKVTNMEELKIENQMFIVEIQRLHGIVQELKDKGHNFISEEAIHDAMKDSKSNKAQILLKRLTDDNRNLVLENKSLKNDLFKLMPTDGAKINLDRDYEDMNRTELLQKITSLEQQLKVEEKSGGGKKEDKDTSDATTVDPEIIDERCIELKGPLSQQIKQLRAREKELLTDIEKLEVTVKKLKEDRAHYRKMTDDYRKQLDGSKKEVTADSELEKTPRNSLRKRSSSSVRKSSCRSNEEKSPETVKEKRPMTPERAESVQGIKERRNSRKSVESVDRKNGNESHGKKVQQPDNDDETDEYEEAIVSIQSAWRAHHTRQNYVKSAREKEFASYYREEAEDQEDVLQDEDISLIQAAFRGHSARKQLLNKNRKTETLREKEELLRSDRGRFEVEEHSSPHRGSNYGNNDQMNAFGDRDESDDDDDDVVIGSSASLTRFRNDKNRSRNPTIYKDPDTGGQNRDWYKTESNNAKNLQQESGSSKRDKYQQSRGSSSRSKGNLSLFLEENESDRKQDGIRGTSGNNERGDIPINKLISSSTPWTNSRNEIDESAEEGTPPPALKQRRTTLQKKNENSHSSRKGGETITNKWASSGSKENSNLDEKNFHKKLSMRKTQQLLSDFNADVDDDDDDDDLMIAPSFQKRMSAAMKKKSALDDELF